MKKNLILMTVLVVFGIAVEVAIRFQGVIDFPLYDTDDGIGYIPKPNQKGSYLNRFPWKVNEKNMTSGPWAPNQKPDLLLIGDSIVWGGEEYRHEEKLGPQLQKSLPEWSVWAVGASSWSIQNEVEYLRRNSEVVEAVDQMVWILNSEDYGPKAGFFTDANTPRSRPWSASIYAIRKYLLPKDFKGWLRSLVNQVQPPPVRLPIDPAIPEAKLIEALDLCSSKGKPVLILAYPNRAEWISRQQSNGPTIEGYETFLARLESIRIPNVTIFDGRHLQPWGEGDYRDDIHPTAEGNQRLAKILAQKIQKQTAAGN